MQRVAEPLSERGLSEAKMTSIERRLARFIGNSRIVVPLIWTLFLTQVVTPFRGQSLYFVLDNTPFRDELTIVYLGTAGAFASLASGLGRDASPNKMG